MVEDGIRAEGRDATTVADWFRTVSLARPAAESRHVGYVFCYCFLFISFLYFFLKKIFNDSHQTN